MKSEKLGELLEYSFFAMQEGGYQFATICSSNVNRSMEAHSLFQVCDERTVYV